MSTWSRVIQHSEVNDYWFCERSINSFWVNRHFFFSENIPFKRCCPWLFNSFTRFSTRLHERVSCQSSFVLLYTWREYLGQIYIIHHTRNSYPNQSSGEIQYEEHIPPFFPSQSCSVSPYLITKYGVAGMSYTSLWCPKEKSWSKS